MTFRFESGTFQRIGGRSAEDEDRTEFARRELERRELVVTLMEKTAKRLTIRGARKLQKAHGGRRDRLSIPRPAHWPPEAHEMTPSRRRV